MEIFKDQNKLVYCTIEEDFSEVFVLDLDNMQSQSCRKIEFPVNTMALVPNSCYLVLTERFISDSIIWKLNLSDGKMGRIFNQGKNLGNIISLLVTPDSSHIIINTYISYTHENILKILEIKSKKVVATQKSHSAEVNKIIVSLDSSLIFSCSSDNTGRVWSGSNLEIIAVLKGHIDKVNCACVDEKNTLLATGSWDNTVRIWKISEFTCVKVLAGHTAGVAAVVFDRTGKLVISAGVDITVKVWDISAGICINSHKKHQNNVESLTVFRSNKYVISGSIDGTAIVWKL